MKKSKKNFRRTIATLVSGCVVGSTCFINASLIQAESTTDTIQAENQIISQSPNAVISSNQMNVLVDVNFPRVIQYDLKSGNDAGKTFYGQTEALDTILINDVAVKPKVKANVL